MLIHKTIAVVIERDGKILLLKKPQHQPDPGKWAVPGGHVDSGESVHLAAKREMDEEVGGVEDLEETGRPFVHDVDSQKVGPHKHICHIFRATITGEPKIDKKEADDWAWLMPEEAKRLNLTDWTKKLLIEVKFLNRDHKRLS